MPFWNILQWQLTSFVPWYIRVTKLHSGPFNHWVSFHFTSQSWALSEKDWGQRIEWKVIHQYRVFFLYLIWWNVHCCQFFSLSVSRTLLINRCEYWMIARLYQPNEKMHLVPELCITSTMEKIFFLCSQQPFTRPSFPLIIHFYSFPGPWSFFVCLFVFSFKRSLLFVPVFITR